MSFWSDFEAALNKAIKSAESTLLSIATQIKPMVVAGAEEVALIALNAVAGEAPKVLSGQEKFNSAVSTVVTGLASNGKSIAISVAEAAVQSAYNTLSSQLNKSN